MTMKILASFLISLLITGFARPSDVPYLGVIASFCGYSIFWHALSKTPSFSWLWLLYFGSSLLQTRWLLSHPFLYIVGIWLFLAALLSLPYAYLTKRWLQAKKWTSPVWLAASFSLFDLIEPHLFFSGISFRSIGSFLMATPYTSELITLFGGTGLTFLVIYLNGLTYQVLEKKASTRRLLATLVCLLLLGATLHYTLPVTATKQPLKVAVVHWNNEAITGTTTQDFYDAYCQSVQKLMKIVPTLQQTAPDIIVLPEGAMPFALDTTLMDRSELPPWIHPYLSNSLVSSYDIFKAIALKTHSSILFGLERKQQKLYYNSCFLFLPDGTLDFYDKRVLVPGGEYIPMEEIFKPILKNYGISSSFQEGKEAKVLCTDKAWLYPLICYEETLSRYIQPARALHSDVLVALSNDHWFPSEFFSKDHWLLGKMRAMECGLPIIRCANMGQSGVILADGTEIAISRSPNEDELLIIEFLPTQRTTLYSLLLQLL